VISAFPTPKRYWSPRKLSDCTLLLPFPNSSDHLEPKVFKEVFPKAEYKKARIINVDVATMKLRTFFVWEVVLVIQAAWVVEGPAFIFCDKFMVDGLLKFWSEEIYPQRGSSNDSAHVWP